MRATLNRQEALQAQAASQSETAPLLVRHAWLGWGFGLACTLAFILLTWQVTLPNPSLIAWDTAAANAIYNWAKQQSLPVEMFIRFWSAYGREGTGLILIVLTFVWAHQRKRRLLWMVYFGVAGAELWFQIFHNLIDRPRPEYKDPFETLLGAGYPSGHVATNAVLGMLILYLLLPRIRSPLNRTLLALAVVGLVVIIGFARLFLGLHYPTDIIAGLLLGLGWGTLVLTFTENYFWRQSPEQQRRPESGRP